MYKIVLINGGKFDLAKKQSAYKVLESLSQITQFGFSIVSPLLILIWIAIWLKSKFLLGDWVVFAAIILGLASSFTSAVSFFKCACRQAKKSEESDKDE